MSSKLKIPPGPTPIVDNGQVAVNAILLVLAPIFVVLRFWARKIKNQKISWDDYTILVALVINTALCSHGIWAGSKHYIGYVIPFMKANARIEYKKAIYVDVILCHLIYGLIKISVVLFYRRIFLDSRNFSFLSNTYLGVVAAWIITTFFGFIFCAGKPSAFWTGPPGPLSTKINYGAFLLSMSAIDIFLDLVVLIMPLPIIRRLNMSRQRRLQIGGVFMLGAFCLVAGSVRMYYSHSVLYIVTLTPYDRTRNSNLNHLWGHVEATASIIAACLPTIVPVFTHVRSADSLVGSARKVYIKSASLFSLQKKSSMSNIQSDTDEVKRFDPTNPSKGSSEGVQEWYDLNHGHNTVTVAAKGGDA